MTEEADRPRPPARRVRSVLVALAALLVGAILLLQTPVAATALARVLAARFAPAGLDVELGRVGWFPLTSLDLRDLAVTDRDGGTVLRIEHVEADQHLLASLPGRIRIGRVSVTGAHLVFQDRPDGTWGLGLPVDTTTAPQSAGIDVSVQQLQLTRSRMDIVRAGAGGLGAEWSDTTLTIQDVTGRIRELRFSPDGQLVGQIDAVEASARMGALPSDYPLELSSEGQLEGRSVRLGPTVARGRESRVSGTVLLDWAPLAEEAPPVLDATLTSDAFTPNDIRAIAPGWKGEVPLDLRLVASGPLDSLSMEVAVDAAAYGSMEGHLTWVAGERTPGFDWTVGFHAIDPRLAAGPEGPQGSISGTSHGSLRGPTPPEWSGPLRVDVEPSPLGAFALGASRVTLDFRNGTGDGTGSLILHDSAGATSLSGDVTVIPFETVPEYAFTGQVRRSASTGPEPSDLVALVDLAGSGASPSELALDANMSLDPSTTHSVGGVQISEATAELRVARGEGAWRFDLAADHGSVAGTGQVVLSEQSTIVEASNVMLTDIDVASLLGDTVPSHVSGRATGSLVLAPQRAPVSEGSFTVSDVLFGQFVADSARGSWVVRDSLLTGDLAAWSDSGRVEARVNGSPFAEQPRFAISDGILRHFDVGSVLAAADSTTPSTSLEALFNGSWSGASPETAQAELNVRLLPSRIQEVDSVAGTGVVSLAGGRLVLRGDGAASDATLQAEAWLRPFAEPPSWEITEVTFQGVDPSAWTGAPTPLPTNLQGSLRGTGSGLLVPDLSGQVSVVLDESTVGERRLERARLDVDARDGRFDLDATLKVDSLVARALGWVEWAGDSTEYEMRLLGDIVDAGDAGLGDLGGPSPANQSADPATRIRGLMSGRGFRPATATARLTLDVDSVGAFGIRLDSMAVRASLASGALTVDSLRAEGPGLSANASGAVALAEGSVSDLVAEITLTSFDLVRPLVPTRPLSIGEGHARLTMAGPHEAVQVDAMVDANAILFGDLQLRGLTVNGGGLLAGATPSSASATVTLNGLGNAQASVGETTLDIRYDGDDIGLQLESAVDERRTLDLAARLDPRPDARTIVIETFNASVDEDVWTLVDPATLRYGEVVSLDTLELRAGNQTLLMAGRLSAVGPQFFAATLENFRIGTVADLLGWEGFEGTLGGTIDLGGDAQSPLLETRYRMDMTPASGPQVELSGVLDYANAQLTVQSELVQHAGQRRAQSGALDLDGVIPVALGLPWADGYAGKPLTAAEGPVDLTLSVDSLTLDWLRPLTDPAGLLDLQGVVDSELRVTGTAADPRLSGGASLTNGAVRVAALGTTWENLHAGLSFDGSSIVIDSFSVESDEGPLTALGTVDVERLTVGAFDVSFEADAFRVIDNALARATASGSGKLEGTTAQPSITATIQLLSTDVFLDGLAATQGASDVELTEEDYEQLQATFGRDYRRTTPERLAIVDSLALEVSVSMGRDTWVRQQSNPHMALQMSGDIRIEKARGDSLMFFGEITTVPERSYIEQFGRRFALQEGEVILRGLPSQTQIDVVAVYSVPSSRDPDQAEVTIRLGVEGTPDQVNLTLSSDPTMDNSDIVSYLATGRPASQDLQVEGQGGFTGVGTDIAVGAVANALESAAAEQIGLDVIDIRTDGLRGATLVAGRYVSPSLFVGFEQPLSRGSSSESGQGAGHGSQVQLEYQALRWLLLNLELGGRGFDFLLRSRYAY